MTSITTSFRNIVKRTLLQFHVYENNLLADKQARVSAENFSGEGGATEKKTENSKKDRKTTRPSLPPLPTPMQASFVF